MSGLKKFQNIIKERLEIRKRINEEIKWMMLICQDVSNHLELSLISNIISKTVYSDSLSQLNECMNIISLIPFIIPLSNLNKLGSYSYAIKISKIKFQLITIIQEIGCCKLEHISKLMLDTSLDKLEYSQDNFADKLVKGDVFIYPETTTNVS